MRPGAVWGCGRVTARRVGESKAPHWVALLWTTPWEMGEPGPQWTNLVWRGWLRSTDGLSLAKEVLGYGAVGRTTALTPREEEVRRSQMPSKPDPQGGTRCGSS